MCPSTRSCPFSLTFRLLDISRSSTYQDPSVSNYKYGEGQPRGNHFTDNKTLKSLWLGIVIHYLEISFLVYFPHSDTEVSFLFDLICLTLFRSQKQHRPFLMVFWDLQTFISSNTGCEMSSFFFCVIFKNLQNSTFYYFYSA